MRRILEFLLLLAAGVLIARADTPTVFFNLGDFTTAPIAYKQVRIAPAPSSFPRVEGSQVIGRDLIFKSTDASGQFYITNMVPGDYDVTFTNRFLPTTFRITVVSTTGVVNAYSLTSSGTNSPSNLAAYSISAANALFVTKSNFLAASNYLYSISGGGGGGEVSTAQLLAASNYLYTGYTAGLLHFTNWTAAISNLVNTKAAALTNLVTASTNGLIHSLGSKGTNNQWYAPMLFTATNTGDFRVTGNAAVLGSLSSSGASLGGGNLTSVNGISLGTGTINWDGLTGDRFLRLNSARDTVSSAYDDGDITAALADISSAEAAIQAAHDTNAAQQLALGGLTNISTTKIDSTGGIGTNNYLGSPSFYGTVVLTNTASLFHYLSLTNATQTTRWHIGDNSGSTYVYEQQVTTNEVTHRMRDNGVAKVLMRFFRYGDWSLGMSGGSGTNLGHVTIPVLNTNKIVVLDANGRLINASGTPDGSKFLRDDGVLATPPGAGGGEANTASSLGTGWRLFSDKSSVDLRFNTLTNGSGLGSSSNNNLISLFVDWVQTASQTNLTALSNLVNSISNLAYLEGVYSTNWSAAISNLAQAKIPINGGGGTNNALTNATWFEKLTSGPNTNGFFTVSNSSATAVGVLHFISTNGGGYRSIWSLNLTNGDMTIAGAMSMDQLNLGTLNLTNWMSIGGPFTNTGWSFLSGVTASSVVRATNLFPHVEALTLATNANGVTNILLNITNRGALVLYPTNGLAWTNIVGFTTDAAPTLTAYVFMQAGNQTNLWPSGNLHGYRVHTNDNSTLWATFTNNNLYIVTVTGVRSNAIFTCARFSGL